MSLCLELLGSNLHVSAEVLREQWRVREVAEAGIRGLSLENRDRPRRDAQLRRGQDPAKGGRVATRQRRDDGGFGERRDRPDVGRAGRRRVGRGLGGYLGLGGLGALFLVVE